MDTSTSSVKFAEEIATKTTSSYRKRPPTPTRFTKKFELGELENDSSGTSKSSRLNPDVEREEAALKDELLRIFGREKDAMETHYLGKIQELLRSFKSKKLEWEEMVRAEREELERQFDQERTEIHHSFAQEITKMTRSFQDDKLELERKYENRQKDRDSDLEREKNELNEKWKLHLETTRKDYQRDFEIKLDTELRTERDRHKAEMEFLAKKLENAQYDLEKRHERELNDAEAKFQKVIFDMEKKFDEEKNKIEKEWQRKLENIEDALRKETNYRMETEKLATHEKENLKTVNSMLKDELNRLKDEVERLRNLPLPQPEIKIVEKFTEPPPVTYNTRSDLPANLRDDFDRIINEYKATLKEKFDRERVSLEEKMQVERDRMQEKMSREKEELDKKLNEEKFRMERDLDRSKDDIEKEIERRLRTKQLSDSLLAQQQRFDEVARRLEEEEKARYERLRETELKQFEARISDLRSENDALKAKVHVLEDNNKVLKSLKEEGQKEVERLRKAVEDLRNLVESRSDKTRAQTPAEFTPFLMTMMHNQQQQQQQQQQQDDPISQKSQLDELYCERKKLEELRYDLQRQEREIRDRKTMEDAAKMAADKSHEKYESLLQEKRKLERQLLTLESRVVNMQDEFVKLRTQQQQQPIMPHPPMPQPIIVQSPSSPTKDITKDPIQPVNVINFPGNSNGNQQQQQSPVQQPQQPQPIHPYFIQPMQSMPTSFSSNEQIMQIEKISKLKSAKERLTHQLEDLQRELRDANQENSILQKQCQDYERRLDKLTTALDREQELTNSLKEALSEERMRMNKLKDDLDRESENVVRARAELEELRSSNQQEIQELQTKLHTADITLATVRQRNTTDVSNTMVQQQQPPPQPNYNMPFAPPKDATVGYVTLPSMPQIQPVPQMTTLNHHYYPAPTGRRRLSLNKTADSFTAAELDQVRTLEEEKLRLQRQLQDAKGALDAYAGKLGQQQVNHSYNQVYDYTRKPPTPVKSCDHSSIKCQLDAMKYQHAGDRSCSAIELEKSQQQTKHLRQQKVQLQKLIERLTYLGPQQGGEGPCCQ